VAASGPLVGTRSRQETIRTGRCCGIDRWGIAARRLVGEAKLRIRAGEWMSLARMLQEKIDRLPFASNYQSIVPMLFVAAGNPPKNLPVKHRQAERILSLLK
jgi:hypothetical protein